MREEVALPGASGGFLADGQVPIGRHTEFNLAYGHTNEVRLNPGALPQATVKYGRWPTIQPRTRMV